MAPALQELAPFRGYSPQKELPLGSYAVLLTTFGSAFGWLLAKTRGRAAPKASEVVLLGLATHKLTRIIARDAVTGVVRAPFTQFEGEAPAAEVDERSRGRGLRKAVGQLVSCQYCLGPWVAGALTFAHAVFPRETRRVAGVLTSVLISDFLHRTYQLLGVELQQAYKERDLLEGAVEQQAAH
jgi:hypothetical protein